MYDGKSFNLKDEGGGEEDTEGNYIAEEEILGNYFSLVFTGFIVVSL